MIFARAALLSAALAALTASSNAAPALPDYTYALQNVSNAVPQISPSLQSCLESTGVNISYPTNQSYSFLDIQQNAALPQRLPVVFALPKSEKCVAKIVKCVAAEGGSQKISSRSGGHSYAGYNLGGANGWVVVDLRRLDKICIDDGNKQATVGSGNRLGPMAERLAKRGYALPHGTCPSVGTGGHSLGGGYGYASHGWGYLLDHIESMRLVKPDGEIVTVSAEDNPELFYALRGAGQNNFGIVTSFTYNLETAPDHIINFSKTFASNADCVQAMLAIQTITAAKGTDGWEKAMGAQLLLTGEKANSEEKATPGASSGPGGACTFLGQYLGTKEEYKHSMSKFNSAIHKRGVWATSTKVLEFTSWQKALEQIMGQLNVTDYVPGPYYAKSLITPMSVRYDEKSASALMASLDAAANYGASISLDLLGPNAYSNHVNSSSSAFVHRDALWVSQYLSENFPKTNEDGGQDKVYAAFNDMVETAKAVDPSAAWGGYYNYIDNELLDQDWGNFYWGSAVGKLKELKKTIDPLDIFDFPMAINRAS